MQGGVEPAAGADPAGQGYCQYLINIWPRACGDLEDISSRVRVWANDAWSLATMHWQLVIVILIVLAVLALLWRALGPSSGSRARRALNARDLIVHPLGRWERLWLAWFVLTRWHYWYPQANAVLPLAYRSKDRWIFKRATVQLLNHVQERGRPEALILRNALHVPNVLSGRLTALTAAVGAKGNEARCLHHGKRRLRAPC